MWKTVSFFIKDLWTDGYKFIGAIAPILSIGFTIAKATEVHVSLRDISYAWAFAPLLVWLFMAYLKRWRACRELEAKINKSEHDKIIRQYLAFMVHDGEALKAQCANTNEPLPKNEVEAWALKVEEFLRST
jgi:hypothetical protein